MSITSRAKQPPEQKSQWDAHRGSRYRGPAHSPSRNAVAFWGWHRPGRGGSLALSPITDGPVPGAFTRVPGTKHKRLIEHGKKLCANLQDARQGRAAIKSMQPKHQQRFLNRAQRERLLIRAAIRHGSARIADKNLPQASGRF